MANRLLAIIRNTIPYVPAVKKILKDTNATILMQQLEYWFDIQGEEFYKFQDRPENGHKAYREGDSWCEELTFSSKEFRTAFSKIGISYKSKGEFDKAEREGNLFKADDKEYYYISYHNRITGLVYYYRNNELMDKLLDNIVNLSNDYKVGKNKKSEVTVNSHMEVTVNDQQEFTEVTDGSLQEVTNGSLHYTETTLSENNPEIIPTTTANQDLEEVIHVFEKEFARPLNFHECELVKKMISERSKELILHAIPIAMVNRVYKVNFVDGIIKNWGEDCKTVGDAMLAQERHEKGKLKKEQVRGNKTKAEENKPKSTKYDKFYL